MYFPQANPHATPTLPPEILEKILDDLVISSAPQRPWYDVKTLKSWSLVSRAWAPRAQRRIFYRVDLVISREGKYLEFLENVVRHSEYHGHLATYIKCLLIHRSYRNPYGPLNVLSPHFPAFLNQLSMLREISISLKATTWGRLSGAESETFIRAFQLPSLRTISVNVYGGFPLSLLSSFGPAVQALRVGALGLTIEEPRYPPSFVSGVANLKHLEINTINVIHSLSRFLTNKTTNNGSFRSLESIRIVLRSANILPSIPRMKPFFEQCPSLCYFGIASRTSGYRTYPVIELQRLDGSALQFMVWHNFENYSDSLHTHEWIIALLQCLPSLRTLQRVRLENHFHHSVDIISWVKHRYYQSWQALDEYFSQQPFPALKIFTLGIGISDEWEARVLASCLKSRENFAKLKSEGVFNDLEILSFKPYLEW